MVPMETALVLLSLGFGPKIGTKLNVKKKKTVNVYFLNKLFYFIGL